MQVTLEPIVLVPGRVYFVSAWGGSMLLVKFDSYENREVAVMAGHGQPEGPSTLDYKYWYWVETSQLTHEVTPEALREEQDAIAARHPGSSPASCWCDSRIGPRPLLSRRIAS